MLGALPAYSQADSLQTRTLELTSADTTLFLGFLIETGSVSVVFNAAEMNNEWWNFDGPTGELTISVQEDIWKPGEEITITYRSSILSIDRILRLREFIEITDTTLADTTVSQSISREIRTSDDLFGDSELNQSGSLTRGFTVGNRQDLALDSGLKLDLNGNITDDITIQASLTDRSTPIQPDGATQNIREFDRVYIQLNAPVGQLELGDVDITYDESRFARINRRVQGAVGEGETPVGRFGGGASVTRGQFRTQSFDGIESLQGPYRLSGAENEAFIIVIAGSETVYVNGSRVNRGAENEYIIDYGLGEITFTNNLVVTDETRIVVEFQYITQNFTRTLFTARGREDNLYDGKLEIGATYIREADNKNPNTQFNLTDEDIERLRQLGGDVDDLFVSGADSVGFREDADFLLYARIDTTLNGETFEVFKNLQGDSRSNFRVRFTNVGEGNGSYRRIGGAVNGILYEWAGPGLGRYEPVVRLQAPQSHQMLAVDSKLALNQYLTLSAEWAVSEFDPNRFSSIGNDNNSDMALNGSIALSQIDTGVGKLRAGADQAYIGQNFEFFDRPNEIEFDRQWNILRSVNETEQEQQTNAYAILTGESGSSFEMRGGMLSRDQFRGYRAELITELQEEGLPRINTRTNYVESRDNRLEQYGTWFRHRGDAAKSAELGSFGITPFMNWEAERRIQNSFADSLLPQSLQFYDLNPGIRVEIDALTLQAGVGYRANQRPFENNLVEESFSRSQRFSMDYRPSPQFRTSNRVQFRQKETEELFLDEALTPKSRGVLMSSASNFIFLDDNLTGELFYEANTERRALLQETYIEVGPELGQYIWIDLNDDGVQQIDEFFPEVTPNEGTYIRQFVPSDELLPVIDVTFRARNEIMLGEIIQKISRGESVILQYLTWNSLLEIRETSREENLSKVYFLNPSVLRNELNSINGQRIIRQRLSWRTDDRGTELSLSFNESKTLTQRTVGVQSGLNRVFLAEGEHQVSDPLRMLGTFQKLRVENQNSRFESRNYEISGYDFQPGISLLFNRSAQIEWRTGYSYKQSISSTGEATSKTISLENRAQLFLFNRIQNRLRVQLRRTQIDGEVAGQAEYELTEGIGRGTNVVWSLNSDYRASSLLRISLQYNGRTTTENEIIQTLRLVVSAVF